MITPPPAPKPTVASLKKELEELQREVAAMNASIRQLVEAWNAAGTLVTFVKWAASVVSAFAVIVWAITNSGFWKTPH